LPTDSAELRSSLKDLFPMLVITGVAKSSGQRVVYFGKFNSPIKSGASNISEMDQGAESALEPNLADSSDELDPAIEPEIPDWSQWGPVVIKVVEGITANALTYLQREIAILTELNSPHYPRLYFSETYYENPVTELRLPDRLFVTIEEHVVSKSLGECCTEYSTEQQITQLLIQLVDALQLFWNHKNKIVHRDLKPDNILIRPDGRITIIDLGITRESGADGETNTFLPYGPMTLRYASPEQAKNEKRNISFKSDFFSLGIIAYELASGSNPFAMPQNVSPMEIYNNLCATKHKPLQEFTSVSPKFSSFVDRLLEKEPYRRFRTVDDLCLELNQLKESHNGH